MKDDLVRKEGWFFLKGARLYHYGVEGRRRSLCGQHNTPDPQMFFPEVNHQKCITCIYGVRELYRRRDDDKATLLLVKVDLAVLALMDHVSVLLSVLEFDQMESIIEELRKLMAEERR